VILVFDLRARQNQSGMLLLPRPTPLCVDYELHLTPLAAEED
jgi:hypothetical protein